MGSSKVLVIDDDVMVNAMIVEHLQVAGYTVVSASNGYEGLSMVQREKPDLVITDIIMTRIDGLSVLRTLRQSHPDLPTLVISGGDRAFAVTHLLRVAHFEGADRILAKPFTHQELLESVHDLLSL